MYLQACLGIVFLGVGKGKIVVKINDITALSLEHRRLTEGMIGAYREEFVRSKIRVGTEQNLLLAGKFDIVGEQLFPDCHGDIVVDGIPTGTSDNSVNKRKSWLGEKKKREGVRRWNLGGKC